MAEPSAQADAAPPSLTTDQATAQIEKILGKPAEEEKDKPADPSAEVPDAPASGEPEEPAAEEPPAEVDEDNAEVEGDEAQADAAEERDGRLRHADYTRKTQALAQERQTFAQERQQFAELIQSAQQKEQVYGSLIPVLEEQIKAHMPQEPDWAQLEAHPDKSHYWAARARWDETQRRQQAIADEKDRLAELQTLEVNQKLTEHLDRSRTWLTEQLPAWRDEKRATSDKSKLRDYALKNGFSQYDIDHAYDPRLIVMVYKSMLYDGLVENRPKPTQGESPEPLKPGIATHQPATLSAKLTKAKNRLRQTGRPDDATAAIELILQRGH